MDYFTQVAVLANSKQVNEFGFNTLYGPLVQDIIQLETKGIEIKYKNTVVRLKGTVAFFPADSLAAHQVAGMVESFGRNISKYLLIKRFINFTELDNIIYNNFFFQI